jgi:hypothetical protein
MEEPCTKAGFMMARLVIPDGCGAAERESIYLKRAAAFSSGSPLALSRVGDDTVM